MKKLIVAFGSVSVALSALANGSWGGASGSWFDEAMWVKWGPISSEHAAEWKYENQTNGPVTVRFDGADSVAKYFNVTAPTGVEDNDGPFDRNVTLDGAGATIDLGATGRIDVGCRRRLTLDDIHVTMNSDQYSRLYGELVLRNGASVSALGNYNFLEFHKGGLVLDGASADYWGLANLTDGGSILIKNGGTLTIHRDFNSPAVDAWNAMRVRVIDGSIPLMASAVCGNPGMLPERSGRLLSTMQNGFFPPCADGEKWRLGGELVCTNSEYALFTITNNATVYGRGRVTATGLKTLSGTHQTFALSQVTLGSALSEDGSDHTFLGDVDFKVAGSHSLLFNILGRNRFRGGQVSFDGTDLAVPDKVRSLTVKDFSGDRRTVLSVNGNATHTVNAKKEGLPNRLRGLHVGPDAKLTVKDGYRGVRVRDLRLDAGATLFGGDSWYMFAGAAGRVTIDPSAKIVRNIGAKSAKAEPTPLLTTLDPDLPEPTFDRVTASAGFSVRRVGGCFFWGDGQFVPSDSNNNLWLGSSDANWSNLDNWKTTSGKVPYDATTFFNGYNNTDITIDTDDCDVWKLRVTQGPFVFRGKPMKITYANEGAIENSGVYPILFLCDVNAPNGLGVSAKGNGLEGSPVAFRGNLAVNGTLKLQGETVIDGTASVKDLQFLATTVTTAKTDGGDCETCLAVGTSGVVTVTAQTTVQSAAGNFWIDRGGLVSLTGDLTWNDVGNDHSVFGELYVSGALAGTAAQKFGGTGLVDVETLTASGVRLGEGIVLRTRVAQTTPTVVTIEHGGATLAPQADLTLAGGVDVAMPGEVLTVSNDCAVTMTGALTGHDFDLVKTGSGTLTLAEAPGLARGYVTVSNGTLALTKAVSVGKLRMNPGTALDLGAPVVAADDVTLTGSALAVSDVALAADGWQSLVTVPFHARIIGLPETTDGDLRLRVRELADGSKALQAKRSKGLMLIFR